MNANRGHANKSQYRSHRDEWVTIAYCIGFTLVIAAIEWLR